MNPPQQTKTRIANRRRRLILGVVALVAVVLIIVLTLQWRFLHHARGGDSDEHHVFHSSIRDHRDDAAVSDGGHVDDTSHQQHNTQHHHHHSEESDPEGEHHHFLFYPRHRSPIEPAMLNCDVADVLRQSEIDKDQQNEKRSGSSSFRVQPCLRTLFFSTLKPCINEENILTQFAAITSWASTLLHPAPVVVLFDTSLKVHSLSGDANDDEQQKNKKRKKNKQSSNTTTTSTIPPLHRVSHRNFHEAEFVKQFARDIAKIDLDSSSEASPLADALRQSAPVPQNGDAADVADNDREEEEKESESDFAPPAVRSSCGWLLAKMVENYFADPTQNISKFSRSGDKSRIVATAHPPTPRIVVAAPPDSLVGKTHHTLLLGPTIKYVQSVVAPALRPADGGIFDVFGFVNSDIVFGPRLGAVLASSKHAMRRFLLVGRRHSLSYDAVKDLIAEAFVTQQREKARREKQRSEEIKKKRMKGRVNVGAVAAASDETTAEPLSSAAATNNNPSLFPGSTFFDAFFDPNNRDHFPRLLRTHSSKGDRIDAEDYFFFTHNFFERPYFPVSVPGFHIGRPAFDNWLVSNAIHSMQPVADISNSGVLAVHIERSSSSKKKKTEIGPDGVERPVRAYWSKDDASTKENYKLGEANGGWQHGLLEFVPLEVRWIADSENDGNHLVADFIHSKAQRARNSAQSFHESGDVHVGMKPTWKGIGSGVGDLPVSTRRALEYPEAYWSALQRYF